MTQVAERTTPARPQVARYVADYQGVSTAVQPVWLTKLREQSMASFERLGFPTTKLEQWRFTSVAPIAERTFALATDGLAAVDPAVTPPLRRRAAVAVCVNGRLAPTLC